MSLTITFELSDQDIEHFVAMARDAQSAVTQQQRSPEEIAEGARRVFEAAREKSLPEYISSRLEKLNVLAQMVTDEEWALPEKDLERVLSAMAYFSDPNDLIPDRVPGVGFLDDAIMAELVVKDLEAEIDAYNDFCAFRKAETERRGGGSEDQATREQWLKPKREQLHRRMRQRRQARMSSGGWKITLW